MSPWEFRRLVRKNRWLLFATDCQCPLGAALGLDGGEYPHCREAAEALGLTEDYTFGAAMGFDEKNPHASVDWNGYRFGQRMRRVVGRVEDSEP